MKKIKYFVEFLIIIFLLVIFKILGFKLASSIGGLIGRSIGPLFRSEKKILSNISKALPEMGEKKTELIVKKMWENYGRILFFNSSGELEWEFINKAKNGKWIL